jgi:hypothetical protein
LIGGRSPGFSSGAPAPGEPLRHQPSTVAPAKRRGQDDAEHRDDRNDQRQLIDPKIGQRLLGREHVPRATQQVHVGERDQHGAADDRDAAERLHGGVHGFALGHADRIAVGVEARHRLDRHRVGDDVLHA